MTALSFTCTIKWRNLFHSLVFCIGRIPYIPYIHVHTDTRIDTYTHSCTIGMVHVKLDNLRTLVWWGMAKDCQRYFHSKNRMASDFSSMIEENLPNRQIKITMKCTTHMVYTETTYACTHICTYTQHTKMSHNIFISIFINAITIILFSTQKI